MIADYVAKLIQNLQQPRWPANDCKRKLIPECSASRFPKIWIPNVNQLLAMASQLIPRHGIWYCRKLGEFVENKQFFFRTRIVARYPALPRLAYTPAVSSLNMALSAGMLQF